MCIAADTGDTLDSEVERPHGEPGLLQERHDEAAQAAVDVQADLVLGRELGEPDDIVLAPIREVHRGANELRHSVSTEHKAGRGGGKGERRVP